LWYQENARNAWLSGRVSWALYQTGKNRHADPAERRGSHVIGAAQQPTHGVLSWYALPILANAGSWPTRLAFLIAVPETPKRSDCSSPSSSGSVLATHNDDMVTLLEYLEEIHPLQVLTKAPISSDGLRCASTDGNRYGVALGDTPAASYPGVI